MPRKIDPKKALFRKSVELGHGKIRGYDFEKGFDAAGFFESYKDTGFQATNLGKAIDLLKRMQKDKAIIFLGFTSNVSTSGLRDILTYLVKGRKVHFLVTTTGGLEEDIIKTHGSFLHGSFSADGAYLRKNGVNRTGNIFIPNERYIWFEKFMRRILEKAYARQKASGELVDSVDFVKHMGKALEGLPNHKESFTYWAYRNGIPLLCVPLADGAIGDHIYFFKKEHRDFEIGLAKEVELLYDTVINAEKTGAILLGGSVPKHHIMNALMLREGADYTIYVNTAYEQDGSNAGANPEEAKSWGKAALDGNNIKVWGDASIIFPILVAAGFKLAEKAKPAKAKL
ncbi:MAG: deoxyhypusine synthase [Candidatus Micrarchaeota archaeon]|nr:deoxyhypusine synthase [Candidatus Micrarchaeota archaeon]